MAKVALLIVAAATVFSGLEALKINSLSSRRGYVAQRRSTVLNDMSFLHDHSLLTSSVDALNHVMSNAGNEIQQALHSTFNIADGEVADAAAPAIEAVGGLYKVDKTGFIGFFADLIEQAITLIHELLTNIGLGKNTYGYSIVIFTLFSKFNWKYL